MKGIILAGGNGRRLDPLTRITNKHLLPVYKKPMIMYPLETLVNVGIKEIVIVTSGDYIGHFYKLIKRGQDWGVNVHYEIQEGSEGTGAALLCAKDFIRDDDFMVILADPRKNFLPFLPDVPPLSVWNSNLLPMHSVLPA